MNLLEIWFVMGTAECWSVLGKSLHANYIILIMQDEKKVFFNKL